MGSSRAYTECWECQPHIVKEEFNKHESICVKEKNSWNVDDRWRNVISMLKLAADEVKRAKR